MAELLNDEWQACERHCRKFEEAWQRDVTPILEDFLPADTAFHEIVLPELVHIDLEFRLRRRMHARVEEYLQRFPDLRDSTHHVLELIEEEYALRLETEHGLSPTEYAVRFPPLADELERRLSKVRAARTSLGGNFRLGAGDAAPPVVPVVPGCEIVEMLGRGGMGVVYKAHHVALGRTVAVKLLRAGVGADAEERDRFQRETRAVALLQHPNIVQIHEVGAIEGQPYCLLEFVAGGTLQSKLASGPMPARAAADLLEPLARAVHFAHQRGVIHRDIKPGNVLLHIDPAGVVPKITDFGLAKQLDRDQSLTRTGIVLGTAQYMAPEQSLGGAVSPATDVYALGAILYEMLTGRPPLQGTSIYETIQMLQNVDPVPPSSLQPSVPRDLETICLKCLNKGQIERYASAADLADDLKRFLAGEPITARPIGALERTMRWCRRKPAQALVVALFLLVIVGATTAGFWYQQQQAKEHAEDITRQAEIRQKRELATQQVEDAVAQGTQARERLLADLARPGGVFMLINRPAQWDGQIDAARAAVQRARAVAAGADGLLDAEILAQIQTLEDRLYQDVGHRDVALALEKVRLDRSAWSEDGYDTASAEREYPVAFSRAGFAFGDNGHGTSDLVQRMFASPIREQLLASLDDWAYVAWSRRKHDLARTLLQTARLVDPHPWRDKVRDLPAWKNLTQIEKLADQALDDQKLFAANSPQMLHLVGRLLTRLDVLTSPLEKEDAGSQIQKKAETWLRRAQLHHMGDFWLNFQLGMALKPTQAAEAAGYYRTALVIRPNTGAAWNNYGVILSNQKENGEAIRAYRKAIECEPRNVNALTNLLVCLREKSDHAEALAVCNKILAIQPRRLATLNRLGLIRHAQGDYAGAKDAFNQAIAVDANYVKAWNNLANTLRAENQHDEALKLYTKATEIDPQSAIAWTGVATGYIDQKKWAAAAKAAKTATECDSDYAPAWVRLGKALRELNDHSGAVEALEQAVALAPKNHVYWNNLGYMLHEHRKLDAAAKALEKSIALNSKVLSSYLELANVYRDLGRFADGLKTCDRGAKTLLVIDSVQLTAVRLELMTLVTQDKRLARVLSGAKATPVEQVSLANHCRHYKGRYRDAVRLYDSAFKEQPTLAESLTLKRRYHAALAALLAADGKDAGSPVVAPVDQARYREQALAWARADLAQCVKCIEGSDKDEAALALAVLKHWASSSELAMVRDSKRLDELQSAERDAWKQFWADLAMAERAARPK